MWVGLFHGTIPIVAQTADLGPIDGSGRFRYARPANIGRYDLLDRFRLDVEVLEARQGPARHVVHPEKINLACGQRRGLREDETPPPRRGERGKHHGEAPTPRPDR